MIRCLQTGDPGGNNAVSCSVNTGEDQRPSSKQSGRENKFILTSPFVPFRPPTDWKGPLALRRAICFTQSTNPNVILSRNILTDTPRTVFNQIPGNPLS